MDTVCRRSEAEECVHTCILTPSTFWQVECVSGQGFKPTTLWELAGCSAAAAAWLNRQLVQLPAAELQSPQFMENITVPDEVVLAL